MSDSQRDIYVSDERIGRLSDSFRNSSFRGYTSDSDGSYEKVYPVSIFVDLRTGDYFPVTANVAHADQEAKDKYVRKDERLVGTFKYGTGYEADNRSDIVLLAVSRGIEGYGRKVCEEHLGVEKTEEIIASIDAGKFYSDKYAPSEQQVKCEAH